MQCNTARTFLSQIAEKQVSMQVSQGDLDFLGTNGYVSVFSKEQYDQALAELSNLSKMTEELHNETVQEMTAETALTKEERKIHSILFHLEGKEKKEAELQSAEAERSIVSTEKADIAEKDSRINELLEKKSMMDRMVPYDGQYLSLTGLGVMTLNDLNVRNYRVSETEFSDFIQERLATYTELRSIADKGNFYTSALKIDFPGADLSQLWSVSIGLGKLQGDPNQINQRFLLSLGIVQHYKSNLENKMMAAEIMTASKTNPSQTPQNSDLQSLAETLQSLEKKVRRDSNVPKELSVGVAATILFARRYDGTYPIDNLVEFSKGTLSCEAAAILSIMNLGEEEVSGKFQQFKSLFSSWGYEESEDTELASAYLTISDLGRDEVKDKMTIILDALKKYLEYPLVATAILTSIPTLEANETLDLMEKASAMLGTFAPSLERSELISLSVRMIHGIKNELVKELDPTAKIAETPVQFTYVPSTVFFMYTAPLIIAHSSYHSTFSALGSAHPAHVHGVGGFAG